MGFLLQSGIIRILTSLGNLFHLIGGYRLNPYLARDLID
ncbi:hypothetical protein BH695_4053 [Microcystis aeruginosa PCC 7806SL]|uniref:Uncharacterized protein n=1 Tax=Microcystis aeruginosa PCC 7806SL TaxID=1903187 RepID=A0AB33BTY0_MICA7|nr:hypothetical protein BH695_4053 [Microcystis aeruginosa PCC 7806SL]